MKRLFQDLGTLTNREICNHSFYKYHFCTVIANLQPVQYEIDKEKILRVIQGKYNYLMAVYGKENIPQDLQKPYNILKKKRDILDADVVIPPEENRLTRDDLPF